MRDAPEPSKSPAAARAAKKAAEAAQAAQAASEAQGNANDDTNGDGITRIPGQATGLADSSGDTQDAVSQNAQAAKPSYSSDAASHPFAVPEKTSLEHVNGDVLQEELPNTMRPAEPLPNGDSNGGTCPSLQGVQSQADWQLFLRLSDVQCPQALKLVCV
jgi:hypothetical protein